jgi:replicative superfamily II helicase
MNVSSSFSDEYQDGKHDDLGQLTQCRQLNSEDNSIRSLCDLLLLPMGVSNYYEKNGITQVYDWQMKCVRSTGVTNGRNLLYCAPTGGGKSLVAELVMLASVLVFRKKAIFVLPFVSLVMEKEKQLKSLAYYYNSFDKSNKKGCKIKVASYYGDKNWNKDGLRENIIVCTIDKANNILNTLVLRGSIQRLGSVIIDEIHTLGESFNGFLLEVLIRSVILFLSRVLPSNLVQFYFILQQGKILTREDSGLT